jgi:peptide/nickel transport system permease protein
MALSRLLTRRRDLAALDTPGRIVLRALLHSPSAIVGASIVAAYVVLAVLAPHLSAFDPTAMAPEESLRPPGPGHLFGTDDFGRDIATRILYGTRISLTVGVVAVGIGGAIGLLVGLLVGYFGGVLDFLVMRLIDIMLTFPGILLALLIMTILGPSLTNVMIAVGISDIPVYVRLVRSSVLAAREQGYTESARGIGCSRWAVIFKHILPNVLAPFIVVATLEVANAILLSATLSFLGMGAQPPTPEWGAMLNEGRRYIRTGWWMIGFPGLAIMLAVLGINLLGDGLRDALDPRLTR